MCPKQGNKNCEGLEGDLVVANISVTRENGRAGADFGSLVTVTGPERTAQSLVRGGLGGN